MKNTFILFILVLLKNFCYSQKESTPIMVDITSGRIEKVLSNWTDVCAVQRIPFTNDFAIARDFNNNKFIIDRNFKKISSDYKEIEPPANSIWFESNMASETNKFLIFTEVINGKEKKGLLELTNDSNNPLRLRISSKFDFLQWDGENFLEGTIYENGKMYETIITPEGIEIAGENLTSGSNFELENKFQAILKSYEKFNQNEALTRIPQLVKLQNGYVAINVMNGRTDYPTSFTHYVYNGNKEKVFSSNYPVVLYSSSKNIILTGTGHLINSKGEKIERLPGIDASVKSGYTVQIYRNYFDKLGFAWVKILDSNFLLNQDLKIILKDFIDLTVWQNGVVTYKNKNGVWNYFNTNDLSSLSLPQNCIPEVVFLDKKAYYYFKVIDPNSSEKYIVKLDKSTQSTNDFNKIFAIRGEQDIKTLKDIFPQAEIGGDFYVTNNGDEFQGKIFLRVNNKFLAKDKQNFLWNSSKEENCEVARNGYLINNPDVKKAGMDPWTHYQNYGKKEGRKWPNCRSDIPVSNELTDNKKNSASLNSNETCAFPFSTDIPKLNITFVDNRKKCECCNSALAQFTIKDKNQAILEEEVLYLMEVMESYFISNKVSSSERDRIQKCMNEYLIKKYGAFTAMTGTVGNLERFLGAGIFSERMSTDRKIPLYRVSDFCSKRCENDPRCQE